MEGEVRRRGWEGLFRERIRRRGRMGSLWYVL